MKNTSLYKFKKMLFSTDNDFVLWHLAKNSDLVEEIIRDKSLNLTLNDESVKLDVFAYHAYAPNQTGITSKKHTINFILGQQYVWIGKWQYDRYCLLKKESDSPKPR